MKYIKKFLIKESVDIEEVQDFCDNALAYLLDEGFEVSTYNGSTYISILLKIPKDLFYWSEYKDDIIPFIEYLYKKYDTCDERISLIDKFNSTTQIKVANTVSGIRTELIDNLDEIEIDYLLSGIFFYINLK